VRSLAQPLIAGLLLAACAGPPRADLLADLDRRASAQRARSAEVERYLQHLDTTAAPQAPVEGVVRYYELVTFRSEEPLDSRYEPGLRAQLAQALEQGAARSIEYRGAGPPVRFVPPWAGQQFAGVSLAALFAAAHAAVPQYRGAEFDVRVALDPGPPRLVTVIHEVDGSVAAIDAVAHEPEVNGAGPAADALRARHGIGPVAGWDARERASLDQALGLLRPAERAVLAGLPFGRKGRAALLPQLSSRGRHCGHFELELEQRSIAIYDCAFEADAHAFVGSLDRPLRPSVRIILHEIGHALAAAPLGSLLLDVMASQREARQMVDEFNQLGRRVQPHEVAHLERLQGEIETLQANLTRWHAQLQGADHLNTSAVRAFLKLEGASSGFTPYGRTTPAEGFAEAFSLCRTDPAAGRRISREVCDFFESDWI